MADHQAFVTLIEQRVEGRRVEFKQSIDATDRVVKAKVTRTIMAMANLQDGGRIIIGMKQVGAGWQPEGVDPAHLSDWTTDKIMEFCNEYADPFIECVVVHFPFEEKVYVGIAVLEFRELPVVCKKEFKVPKGKKFEVILRPGAIYIRSNRKPETVEVKSQNSSRIGAPWSGGVGIAPPGTCDPPTWKSILHPRGRGVPGGPYA